MGAHIVNGQFQSDKYPTTPPGKVPLSVKDPTAQDLLWAYAQRRREVDAEFSEDLETALKAAGFVPAKNLLDEFMAELPPAPPLEPLTDEEREVFMNADLFSDDESYDSGAAIAERERILRIIEQNVRSWREYAPRWTPESTETVLLCADQIDHVIAKIRSGQ